MNVKKISVENGPAGKPILKVTDSKNRIHTFESGDAAAAVPDTTKDSGPDVMQIQDCAQKPHDAANAEYDAAAKNPDTPQAVEKANESWFNALFGLEDGSEDEGSEEPETHTEPDPAPAPETPATPTPTPDTDSEPETVANNVGEVTATDEDTLEIDLGDEVMVIKPKEEASEPTPAAETPAASADCGGAAPAASGQAAGATATESLNQTFEDFLKGL